MDWLIEENRKLNIDQIGGILDAVINRKREVYPDWEIIYYARKKNESDNWDVILDFLKGNNE